MLKCTVAREQLGFTHCLQTTDAGQLARASHGAIRSENYIAVPEKLAAHAYQICHWNPEGHIQRDAVSCRMEHLHSPVARFTPGFGEQGDPIARSGYMVTCQKHTDCYARCPKHPLTGSRYQCQMRYRLYDYAYTDDDGNIELRDHEGGSSRSFDPDPSLQAITGEWGLCVDIDSAMNQGCPMETLAKAIDGVTGCVDRRVSYFLCGLELDVKHGDTSTASIDGSFFYDPPRTLVAAGADLDGDGLPTPAITCTDPIDCNQAQKRVGRSTHTH